MLKKNCEFAEQIVAYIYDEASAKERNKFESHLINCLPCADEIAGFGLVRSSINEWRKEEFFALESPALDIPQLRPIVVSSEKSSWIDELRKLFSFTPAWAGGFAALMICLGLVWFFYNNSKIDTIAEVPAIVEEKPAELPKEEIVQTVNPPQSDIKETPQKVKQIEQKTVAPKNQIVKTVNTPKLKSNPVQPKTNNTMAQNNKSNKNNSSTYATKKDAPKLVEVAEEEDESLRLSELFDEIGSSN